MRAQQSARDGPDQQGAYKVEIDIPQSPVEQAGYTGQDYGVNDIGPHHDLGREAVEQQQKHHDNASRSHRGHTYEKACQETDRRHPHERVQRWRSMGDVLLNLALKQ